MTEKNGKWYSNNFDPKTASRMEVYEGRIRNPLFKILDRNYLIEKYAVKIEIDSVNGLEFEVHFSDSNSTWPMANEKDIKELFKRTGSTELRDLEGKAVDVYIDEKGIVRGISFG